MPELLKCLRKIINFKPKKEYFSKFPMTLRARYKQIEAGALGLREEDDGSYTDFNNQTPATEKQLSKLE